jgi:hypothetical protein
MEMKLDFRNTEELFRAISTVLEKSARMSIPPKGILLRTQNPEAVPHVHSSIYTGAVLIHERILEAFEGRADICGDTLRPKWGWETLIVYDRKAVPTDKKYNFFGLSGTIGATTAKPDKYGQCLLRVADYGYRCAGISHKNLTADLLHISNVIRALRVQKVFVLGID